MPTIGGIELLVLAVVALLVVGPRDLPKLFRGFGHIMNSVRGVAREFQDSMEDLARESELQDLRKQVENVRQNNMLADFKNDITNSIDPTTGNEVKRPKPSSSSPHAKTGAAKAKQETDQKAPASKAAAPQTDGPAPKAAKPDQKEPVAKEPAAGEAAP